MLQKVVIFFTFFFAVIVFFLYYAFYSPENKISVRTIVEIPAGVSVKSVGRILEKNNVINNADIFYYTIRLLEKDFCVQAGKYVMHQNYGVFRAIEVLRGNPLVEDIPVMIPEGLTIWETARIVSSVFENVDSSEFVALCENPEFIERLGLSGLRTLEGYLFPETYRFPQNARAQDIITRLVAMHRRVFDGLPRSARVQNLSDREIVIMASIIEAESKAASERPKVAGVFYNRLLDRNMPIGADATVRFAVRNFDRPIRVSELNSDSPYNTRKFRGLPPGAICSPGRTSLNAALNPAEHEYLFFMARWDGSGEHFFTKTNADHERVKQEVFRRNRHLQNF